MGQKINPLGFRLGTTQDHHSLWFAQPKNYSEGLEEDQKIRDSIKNYVQKNRQKNVQKNRRIDSDLSGIARIEIQKTSDLIKVRIYLAFPRVLSPIAALRMNLQKEFHCVNRKLEIATTRVEEPYGNPIILAQYLAGQLKQRVPFRKAMTETVEKTKKSKIKGIRVQIAGRLGGKDIARVEWIRKGRVPLQTIRAKIDYCSYPVRTIYGVLGIKIWIFRDKK
uniref:Small ribosomal subunit protein uS3c n=1 Tax=Gaultheria leucocarpa var. yunnanensis TaxID=2934325 RepID=A0A9Y1CMH1_9ERIC|nr:ribosomal protein S3 [Gaultheria leucocarpa var. yunnanensis]UOU96040.1 ribosomal protein S3 [Gaultheria leucocarpa var. yunnanensis]UOU96255.1 ribosomal protein S3 [Gaultheria leucocarpa var. yunnanensis]UOU96437.1 ribosomal protein S3 [Gaultheria leucocarpa var. yunnanensis]UOU96586.1 ribosomal protein S3 [Gaultheria leucocarpa var. yunnanensis]